MSIVLSRRPGLSTLLPRRARAFAALSFFLIAGLAEVWAAPLRNVPQTLKQPDGSVVKCLASGHEYLNWLHDAAGHIIVRRPDTGWLVYATVQNGALVPTTVVVGRAAPAGVPTNINPARVSLARVAVPLRAPGPAGSRAPDAGGSRAPTTGTINNVVVYIRFADDNEFSKQRSYYDGMFNKATSGANSMRNYFVEVSYTKLTITTTFYPKTTGTTVVSYKDAQKRGYYQPYNSVTNPLGYQNASESTDREHTLLKNAVTAVAGDVPTSLKLDGDGDGQVDNVCFIVAGQPGAWASLLWPHMWALYTQTVYLNGKRVYIYNLQVETALDTSGVGVLCHEMFHSLGSPDLYHYSYDGLVPVGPWDLMEFDSDPPQHMGAYMKYRYGKWISSIPKIVANGTYTLAPLTSSKSNCYRIDSPNTKTEYFVVEYRRKTGTFEGGLPGSGLLVYRINTALDGKGNDNGPPDEVYIYRPDGTTTVVGDYNKAHFSADVSRTEINDTTNPSSFLSDTKAGGLKIKNVTSAASTISFDVDVGVTADGPDLIITKLDVSPASGLITDARTVTCEVQNQGNKSASSFKVGLWTDRSSAPSPGVTGEEKLWSVTGLTAGQTTTLTYTFTPTKGGTFLAYATADHSRQVTESSETNNVGGPTTWTADQANLTITLAVAPQSGDTATQRTATVTVKNSGTQDISGSFNVDFWRNRTSDPVAGATTKGDQTWTVNGLAKGASTTLTYSFTPTSAGSFTARALADSTAQVVESNEKDNVVSAAWSATTPQVDLKVTAFTVAPSTGTTTAQRAVTITVKNLGTTPANGPFNVDFWTQRTSAPKLGPGVAGDRTWTVTGALAAGASQMFTYAFTPAGAGNFVAYAAADTQTQVGEYNESNNVATASWRATVPPNGPDLRINSLVVSPAKDEPGVPRTATVTIVNEGTQSAANFNVDFWQHLSVAPAPGPNTKGDQTWTIGSLSAGAQQSFTYTFTPATKGLYLAWACADTRATVAETEETDNTTYKQWEVSAPDRDLVISSLTLTPSSATVQTTRTLTVVVKNTGNASCSAFSVGFWRDSGTTPTDVATADYVWAVPSLAGGASTTLTYTFTASQTGQFTAWVVVDVRGQVNEANEFNNSKYVQWTASAATTLPDLTITEFTITPAGGNVGAAREAKFTVKNVGTKANTLTHHGLWLDSQIEPAGPTGYLYSGTASTFQPGESKTFKLRFRPSTAGTYLAWVFADMTRALTESSETNNTKSFVWSVVDPLQ